MRWRPRPASISQRKHLGRAEPRLPNRRLLRDDNMETILPSEFKRQMVLMLDGAPHIVEDMHTSGTAQTRHRLHTRLRHLTTGRLIDGVFAENERVPVAPLETRRVTYSYAQADTRVFIDIETFDEF